MAKEVVLTPDWVPWWPCKRPGVSYVVPCGLAAPKVTVLVTILLLLTAGQRERMVGGVRRRGIVAAGLA